MYNSVKQFSQRCLFTSKFYIQDQFPCNPALTGVEYLVNRGNDGEKEDIKTGFSIFYFKPMLWYPTFTFPFFWNASLDTDP